MNDNRARVAKVGEFREIVDTVIGSQVERAKQERHAWPDYDKIAMVNGLGFMSLGKKDGRPNGLGRGIEHAWGVKVGQYHLERYTGRLTIASYSDTPASLIRRWDFDSPMRLLISSEQPIDTLEGISKAVDWARSPHLNPSALDECMLLTETEEQAIAETYDTQLGEARDLQAGLQRLADLRSRSLSRPLDFRPRIR